jgi:hypothetical protein
MTLTTPSCPAKNCIDNSDNFGFMLQIIVTKVSELSSGINKNVVREQVLETYRGHVGNI